MDLEFVRIEYEMTYIFAQILEIYSGTSGSTISQVCLPISQGLS